jgi:hypothetical protein
VYEATKSTGTTVGNGEVVANTQMRTLTTEVEAVPCEQQLDIRKDITM